MFEEFFIDEELFYRHGPDTGEWGIKYTKYDLVKILKLTQYKVQVHILLYEEERYVNPKNLYRREDLRTVSVETSGTKEPLNIIKGSIYRRRDNPGTMNVYGVSIDDGRIYLLRQFTGTGYQKKANDYENELS